MKNAEQEAERLLAAARSMPVSADIVPNVERRLSTPPTPRWWPWVLVTAAAGAALFVVSRPTEQPRSWAMGIEKTNPTVPTMVPAEVSPNVDVPPAGAERRAVSKAPAPPTKVLARPSAPLPVVPMIAELGTTDERTEPRPAKTGRSRVLGYRPRAIRELIASNHARLAERELSAEVRRILAMNNRRMMLARLDTLALNDADLLVFRGVLRARDGRCPDATTDFARARTLAPKSAASEHARRGAAWCADSR